MKMAAAKAEQSGDECKFEPVGNENKLQVCWAKPNHKCKCPLGKGGYGCVYKGKWQEKTSWIPSFRKSINVAVKHPTGPCQVDYEIATLVKANGHRNILKFYGEVNVESPPSRYEHRFLCLTLYMYFDVYLQQRN